MNCSFLRLAYCLTQARCKPALPGVTKTIRGVTHRHRGYSLWEQTGWISENYDVTSGETRQRKTEPVAHPDSFPGGYLLSLLLPTSSNSTFKQEFGFRAVSIVFEHNCVSLTCNSLTFFCTLEVQISVILFTLTFPICFQEYLKRFV